MDLVRLMLFWKCECNNLKAWEDNMDRKDFLKKACGVGVCGCALPLLSAMGLAVAAETPAASTPPAPPQPAEDWRLGFTRRQYAKMLGFLSTDVPADVSAKIMEKTGRECSKSCTFIAEHRGDVEGYFAQIHKLWGEVATYDREKGIITITTPERPCVCPMVGGPDTPPVICNCSLGWQAQTYETVLGKKVTVTLKEAALRGGKRCQFEIKILG
jgi:predicted hydrocarbon binding protein